MRFATIRWIACLAPFCAMVISPAQTVDAPRIHIVYTGGDNRPPCVAWRSNELLMPGARMLHGGGLLGDCMTPANSQLPLLGACFDAS